MRSNRNHALNLLLAGLVLSTPLVAGAAYRFHGPYAGLQLGYVDGQDDGTEFNGGTPNDYTQETSPRGMAYGLLAGYNMRFGNGFVFGIEADYEGRSADDTSLQKYQGVADSSYPVKTDLKEAASIRARLGQVFNGGQTMVYGTAGYALAKIERTFHNLPDSVSDTSWQDGWTVGAGVEHFVGRQLSMRAEYRYADYGEEDITAVRALWGAGYMERQEYTEHAFRIGVTYHF